MRAFLGEALTIMAEKDYNPEHYRDPTPMAAIAHEAKDEWRRKARKAIYAAKAALKAHGFEAVGRITIIDQRTGKMF